MGIAFKISDCDITSHPNLHFPSILSGHMPVRGEIAEFAPVFNAIRDIHPKVPIYIFGMCHLSVNDVTLVSSNEWILLMLSIRRAYTCAGLCSI